MGEGVRRVAREHPLSKSLLSFLVFCGISSTTYPHYTFKIKIVEQIFLRKYATLENPRVQWTLERIKYDLRNPYNGRNLDHTYTENDLQVCWSF